MTYHLCTTQARLGAYRLKQLQNMPGFRDIYGGSAFIPY